MSIHIIYSSFCAMMESWVVAAETIWSAKPKIFTNLTLYKKGLLSPALLIRAITRLFSVKERE